MLRTDPLRHELGHLRPAELSARGFGGAQASWPDVLALLQSSGTNTSMTTNLTPLVRGSAATFSHSPIAAGNQAAPPPRPAPQSTA